MQNDWTPFQRLSKQEEEPTTKDEGKELHAHVRALLAEMEDEDKDELFADAAEEGF